MKNEKAMIFQKMMSLEGAILIIPLIVIPFFTEDIKYAWMFLLPGALSIILGLVLCHIRIKTTTQQINSNRIVVFSWVYGFFLAAIPFYLYGNVNFVQAVFESVSGFTTTGLSVLDVSKTPQIFLFYRSLLQFVGGLGFVVMMLIFVQGKHSINLYQAEGHPDRLAPNIGKTAKVIFVMYTFFLFLGVALYVIAGMNVFDSILHTMCALSTGGFSNRLDSIGYYKSFPIEVITIFLMLIGTTNFSLLLLLFKGKIKNFISSSEIKFLLIICLIFIPAMTFFLCDSGIPILNSLRLSFFNAFSAISTTGYSTCLYNDWPDIAIVLMVLLMLIGGGIGSTAGGIKLGRVCIIFKEFARNIKKKLLPNRTVLIAHYNKGNENEILSTDKIQEAQTYAQAYLLLFILGSLALSYFAGCSFIAASFEFASSLGTVGLSIGITSATTPSICLIIEIIGMILGRLEIFVLFKIFTKKDI